MKLKIKYNSQWRNQMIAGSNNEPLPKGGRKYLTSGQGLSSIHWKKNHKPANPTHDTVMGILNRLIGDQRKLYQSRQDPNYYFKGVENKVSFVDNCEITNEVVYLRNMNKNSYDKTGRRGIPNDSHPLFNSEWSDYLWSIMFYTKEQIIDYILDGVVTEIETDFSLRDIEERIIALTTPKVTPPFIVEGDLQETLDWLCEYFDHSYTITSGKIKPEALYCSALYVRLDEIKESYGEEVISKALTKRGNISGMTKKDITIPYFVKEYWKSNGNGKPAVVGNPYTFEAWVDNPIEGQKKIKEQRHLSKGNGELVITLDLGKEQEKELRLLINNAGVSAIKVGKKGLAYVV